jgi:DNA-directed RNA polymerase subunit alpha
MLSLSKQPKIIKKEKNKALFEIEALYPGYGVTIGNSLRRILLSSLSGAAITQVKIKGVSHEFSTISGVFEDVISIIMNLKQLRFKIFTNEPQKAFLKVKGEKEVKGAHFDISNQAELVNKDCHIATLTDKSAELEIEVQIEKGIGYSSVESRKEKSTIGTILIDAFFSPVKKVSYEVENMRVGDRTDYDRLFLEIETDGIITPEQAFQEASKILINHFSIFVDSFSSSEKIEKEKEIKKIKKEIKNKGSKNEKTKKRKKA